MVTLNVYKPFNEGEEYTFTYYNVVDKQHLLFNYGFYDDTSNTSFYMIYLNLDKTHLTFQKYKVCKKIDCIINTNIDFFYTNNTLQSVVVDFKLNQRKLNKNLMNLMRLLAIPAGEIINISHVYKRLYAGNWISYRNEVLSYVILRKNLLESYICKSKIQAIDILKIAMITRKYYRYNRARIDSSIRLRYRYKLRTNIFKLAMEFQRIFLKQLRLINLELIKIMKDQFSKLKKFYMEDVNEILLNEV